MKLLVSHNRNRALTLVEVVVIMFSLFILTAVLLPALSAPHLKNALNCVNQLKQTSLAFRVWAGDHQGKYPMAASVTNRGAADLAALGSAEAIFQTMSNDLVNPRILVCPADKSRLPAASFRTLTTRNLSYFVNVDASESCPQEVLLGDDNLEVRGLRVKSGLLEISSNTPVTWFPGRHKFYGNLAMADGSVQAVNNFALTNFLSNTRSVRLAIP